MRVLITGGTGIIGAATASLLAGRGHSVRLLDIAPSSDVADVGENIEIVRGDVQSLADVGAAVSGCNAIVHLAYSLGAATNQSPYAATMLNVQGTATVLEAARLFGVKRVVLTSSVAVYGSDDMYDPEDLPLAEDAPALLSPGMPLYGAGKVYLESLASVYNSRYGLDCVGIRPSPVYGPGGVRGVSGWLSTVIEKAALGESVTVDQADAHISLIYVDDVAEQLAALVEASPAAFGEQRFFNTGGDATTMRELAALVQDIIPEARVRLTSRGEKDVAGLPVHLDGQALSRHIGYERRFDLEAGLRAHIESIRKQAQKS